MGRILAAFSPGENEALFRFYNLEEKDGVISRDLGMPETQLRELRERVRKDFQLRERLQ